MSKVGNDRPFGTFAPSRTERAAMWLGRRLPRSYLGQRAGGWLRAFMRRVRNGPIDCDVLGVRMRLHLDGNATERRLAVTPHHFDPEELELLRGICRRGFCFIDLGANVGTYSLIVERFAGGDARIVAVEANPVAVERLRVNLVLNSSRVMVVPMAVSDREGEVELLIDDRNFGATSIHSVYKGHGKPRRQVVRTQPLFLIVAEAGLDRIDALKADIEGVEDQVLLPFLDQAPKSLWPKVLIIEPSQDRWRADLVGALTRRGYRPGMRAKNLVFLRDATGS